MKRFLHVAPILPTNVEQRIGNLTETGDLDRLHQFFKHVSTLPCNLLQLSKLRLRGLKKAIPSQKMDC